MISASRRRSPAGSKDRPGLLAALDYLRAGDTLCVWKLDRLGRAKALGVSRASVYRHLANASA
ncbi:MAG: recombinase family protein [Mycobacteriales bacterium]